MSSTPSPTTAEWTELAEIVLRNCDNDELSLAVSVIGDVLTTPCIDFIRSRLGPAGSADEQVIHAYVQGLMAAPKIDAHTLREVQSAIRANRLVTPADVDDRLLLAAAPNRTPLERSLVLDLIRGHRLPTSHVLPRRSTGLAVDYTGRAPRQLMALIALLGADSQLTDQERTTLVNAARRAAHPWVTSLVALMLRNQVRLSRGQTTWLAELARPPSVGLDFAALAFSGLRSRVQVRRKLPLDIVPAAGRVTASIAAHAIGEVLHQTRQGTAAISPREIDVLERRLRRLAGHGGQNLAHIRSYRSPPTIPRIITAPLYLNDTHPDTFDYVLVARRAPRRAGA